MSGLKSKPQAASQQGQMPLVGHLRELRSRILKALIALAGGMAGGFWFYPPLLDFLQQPYCQARHAAGPAAGSGESECQLFLFGVLEPFTFRLKIAFIVAAVVSSPVWIYQLWAFLAPGMHRRERRYMLGFVGLGVPFFLAGVGLAYQTLDKGLSLFLGFLSPGMALNLKASQYLTYLVAIMLVFGISFLLPLLVTMLNLAGILSYERLKRWRAWLVFGVCVFAAVATPSQDPFTMLALAIPMVVLMEAATLVAKLHDRRKAARDPVAAYRGLGDDETSPLHLDDTENQHAND